MDENKKKELKEEMERVNTALQKPLVKGSLQKHYEYMVRFHSHCLSNELPSACNILDALRWYWRNFKTEQAPDPFQGPAYQALREWGSERRKERYARARGALTSSSEDEIPQDPATKTPLDARHHNTRSLNGTRSSTTAQLHFDTDSDEHFSASDSEYEPQLSSKKRKKNEPVKKRVPFSQLSRSAAAPFRRSTGQEGMLASDTSDKASQTYAADVSRSDDGSEADSSSEDSSDEDTPALTRKARMAFIELPQSNKRLPLRSTTAREQSPFQRNATPGPSGIQHTPPPPHRNATPGPSGVEHTPPPPAKNASTSGRSVTYGSPPPSQRGDDAQPRVAASLSVQQRLEMLEQERKLAELELQVQEMKYNTQEKEIAFLERRKRKWDLLEEAEHSQRTGAASGQR